MGVPVLSGEVRTLWAEVAASVSAGWLHDARLAADRAVRFSDPEAYPSVWAREFVDICENPLMPEGWAYHLRDGEYEGLLVHPDTVPYIVHGIRFDRLVDVLDERGLGLLPVGPLLAAL